MKLFASDNNSGVHPRVMEALARVNAGMAEAYGDDKWCARAEQAVRDQLGSNVRSWFVFLGTAANVLGLKSVTRPYEAVICSDCAHIYTDECGSPEALIGSKLLPVKATDGKIRPDDCRCFLPLRASVHHVYPRCLSITQSTELGTVYSLEELRAIGDFCKENSLYLHMDGARIANAAVALNVPIKDMVEAAGVDVLSFGGTKNGLMFGELVCFINPDLGHDFPYLRKQSMQLLSKMRYLAAQFIEYLETDLWMENARHANLMAQTLSRGIAGLPHVRIAYPTEVNAVFVRMPREKFLELQKHFYFYIIDENDAEGFPQGWPLARLMTSFNTRAEDVAELVAAIEAL